MRRTRTDRCPGVLRPWPAEDGGLVRVRLPGGRVRTSALERLVALAEQHGDGRLRVTSRSNLQLRGLPLADGSPPEEVVAAVERCGLLPSPEHDRVRNVLASPQTGWAGGRADVRGVVAELDRRICASPDLARLPGRFLFVLDDGRGDLADRHRDLGLVALDGDRAQLRVGDGWGAVVVLEEAAGALAELALQFLDRRGTGQAAAWHVSELAAPLTEESPPEPGADVRSGPLPYGRVPGGEHVPVTDAGIGAGVVSAWASRASEVVVTPWHGVLVPEEETR